MPMKNLFKIIYLLFNIAGEEQKDLPMKPDSNEEWLDCQLCLSQEPLEK